MERTRLDGKRAIVTGGARGIGRSYVERLREMGAQVAVLDLRFDAPADTSMQTEPQSGTVTGNAKLQFEVDLTDERACVAALHEAMAILGGADILVCNAGGGVGAMWENSPLSIDSGALMKAYQVNLLSTALCCREVGSHMARSRSGKIVTVASTSALTVRADGGYAHYASAKAAVIAYTRSLARELAPHNVTANVLVPGAIGTERLLPKMHAVGMDNVVGEIPLGRLGTPDDCADVLQFLASSLSDYVTGAVIRVDGGLAI